MVTKKYLLASAFAVAIGLTAALGANADETSTGSTSTGATSTGVTATGTTQTGSTSTGTTSTGTTSTGATSTGTTATGSTSTGTVSTGHDRRENRDNRKNVTDFSCVKPLVETRETALIAVLDKEQSAIKAALQTRKTALVAAWGLTDKKSVQKAVNAAHYAYAKSVKTARWTALKERLAAWKSFKSTAKTCKASSTVSERDTERADSTETR